MPGTVAVYGPWWLTRSTAPSSGPWLALSACLFLAAGAVYAWCVWDFARFGRGTPAPIDAPRKLVVRGLYRYSRNPMYVGVLSAILAWAVLFRSPAVLAYGGVVALGFHLFVVLYEEPHLTHTFGEEYERYRSAVPRWLPLSR